MARTKYNHYNLVTDKQPAISKFVYPGMFIDFRYTKERTGDDRPLILVLWNEYDAYKLHGLNLNYLSNNQISQLLKDLMKGGKVLGKKRGNTFIVEDQVDETDYDDNLPQRNLLKKPYTRLKLPTYRDMKGGNPLSKSEAKRAMDILYEKVIRKFLNRGREYEVYRTYMYKQMRELKVCNLTLEKLT